MAFEKFTVTAAPKPGSGTGAKATLTKREGKTPGPATLAITLTVALANSLGWSPGDMLDVLLGDGSEHGLIRLRKNRSTGTAEVREKKAGMGVPYISIGLGHVPAFVDRREPAKHINFEAIDIGGEPSGWVEFVMPSWADETGKRTKPGVNSPGPQTAPATFGRTRSVTAGLMGDPPPGRREALAATGE